MRLGIPKTTVSVLVTHLAEFRRSQTSMSAELQVSLLTPAYALEAATVCHFQGALFLYETIIAQ